jgi:hypothetical protein
LLDACDTIDSNESLPNLFVAYDASRETAIIRSCTSMNDSNIATPTTVDETNTNRLDKINDDKLIRTEMNDDRQFIDDIQHRQKLMNQVLNSLKKKRSYLRVNTGKTSNVTYYCRV